MISSFLLLNQNMVIHSNFASYVQYCKSKHVQFITLDSFSCLLSCMDLDLRIAQCFTHKLTHFRLEVQTLISEIEVDTCKQQIISSKIDAFYASSKIKYNIFTKCLKTLFQFFHCTATVIYFFLTFYLNRPETKTN